MERGHLNINSRQVCCIETGKTIEMPFSALKRQQQEDDSRADYEIIAEWAEYKGWYMDDSGLWHSPRK